MRSIRKQSPVAKCSHNPLCVPILEHYVAMAALNENSNRRPRNRLQLCSKQQEHRYLDIITLYSHNYNTGIK